MESTRVCSIGNMDAGGVNMPQGLGRYGIDNEQADEFYLKNHLGSTMLVYGTQGSSNADVADLGEVKNAYDYRATVVAMRTKQQVAKCCPPFGEQVTLSEPTEKVTENFTGKEKDDETLLNYFGARYLDPMFGLWISVDAARQYDSPYTYVGNNPIILTDPDGNIGLLGAAASTPSAFVNLVSAEKKSMEQGNSYAAVVRDGLEAFAVTLIIGAIFGPETALGKALVNAGASAAMNVHDQVTIEHKSLKDVDVEEAAMQSRDGFVAGAIGAGAGSFASKPLLGKTAEIVKNKNQIQNE